MKRTLLITISVLRKIGRTVKIARLLNFGLAGIILIVAELAIVGCATPGRSGHSMDKPNLGYTFQNEKIVNSPFNQVWDNLVRDLAKSYFVINNIEKESRIINLSFYSDTPEKFVDCGKTHRTYSRGKENQEYVYDIAGSSSFKIAYATGPYKNLPGTGYVNRKTSLDGRINIYVAPHEGGTQVTANARYILTANVTSSYVVENAYGVPIANGTNPPSSATCSFNTNQPNTCNWGSGQEASSVTCESKGILETEILSLVQ